MASNKEIKDYLRESGYTEIDMKNFWNENIGTNKVITSLNKYGKTWKDLNLPCIKQLPTQKQRDLEYFENRRQENERKIKEEKEKVDFEKWKEEHFEEYIVNKIDNKGDLTDDEIKRVIWDYKFEEEERDSGRWTQSMETHVKLMDRFFSVYWEMGLTEYQSNEYPEQPVEIEKVEYDKLIPEHYEHIIEWREK